MPKALLRAIYSNTESLSLVRSAVLAWASPHAFFIEYFGCGCSRMKDSEQACTWLKIGNLRSTHVPLAFHFYDYLRQ